MEECLSVLSGKSTQIHNHCRTFRHGHQQTYRHGWSNRRERHHGTNLFSNSKHNFDARHKSSSNGFYMDGFQANSKSGLEPTGDRLLMSRTGGDEKARLNYGGPSRQTSRLAVLNTLKPPISVPNRVAATCNMLSLCSDSSPVDDTEPGLLHFHVTFGLFKATG